MKVMKLMGTKHRALSAVWQQSHREQAQHQRESAPCQSCLLAPSLWETPAGPPGYRRYPAPHRKHYAGNGNRDADNYQVVPQSEGC